MRTLKQAVKVLLQQQVPEERIIFLTRSETEAKNVGRQLGVISGGWWYCRHVRRSLPLATMLAIPGVGPVFAFGTRALPRSSV